jgi:hypothetical protein
VNLASRGSLPLWISKDKKCCLYETPYIAAPMRVLGDVIAKTTPHAQIHSDAPTRSRKISWFTSDISDKICLLISRLLHALSEEVYEQKWYQKGLLILLGEFRNRSFKCLIKDTPLRHGIMSTTLRKPEDQDGCKKTMLSNQPRIMRVTPTAFLGN